MVDDGPVILKWGRGNIETSDFESVLIELTIQDRTRERAEGGEVHILKGEIIFGYISSIDIK
jgi:hypothetical protein